MYQIRQEKEKRENKKEKKKMKNVMKERAWFRARFVGF